MTVANLIEEAKKLSPPERAELLDALVIMGSPLDDDLYLTPAQRTDLDRRIDELEAGNAKLIPGDEAMARLRARL